MGLSSDYSCAKRMNKTVSIIIPNFNGKELMAQNLPVLFSEIQRSSPGFQHEVIVVDDGSTDGSQEFIRKNFPSCKLVVLDKNYGFAHAVNAGVKEARGEIVYLLNSDIKVCAGFLEPIVAHFTQKDVFAVSSHEPDEPQDILNSDKKMGIPLVKFKYGIFWYWYEMIKIRPEAIELYCVSGGHTAYDKEKFLSLGGFDTLFRPFYAEDGDICWRAWKMGWKVLYEPKSIVQHARQGTIGRYYSQRQIQTIHWKNRFLMVWKALDSKLLIMKLFLFAIPNLLVNLFIGKKEFILGFYFALKQFPELLKARKRDRIPYPVYTDKFLFRHFSHPPRGFPAKILYFHEASKISGAENSLINLVKNMDRSKFTPIFVLPQEGPLASELKRLNIEVVLIEFPRIRKGFGVVATIKKVLKVIKEKDVQLIHSNSIRTHIYAVIAARLAKIPVVWHERNLITRERIDPDRLFYFLPDKIICNSWAIARRFIKKGGLPDKVSVIYNGVDIRQFNPQVSGTTIRAEFGLKNGTILVGVISRLGPDKGQEYFLRAAKALINSTPKTEIKFLIVGDAVFEEDKWREDYLKGMVEELGLGNYVIFTGFRRDMPEIIAALDIMVLPADAEPCGRVLFEAMACAKPVVATASGGTPEIVKDGETGFLIRPKQPQEMADKIAWLINNPERSIIMGKEGRKRVEADFKIENNVKKTQAVYLKLLD